MNPDIAFSLLDLATGGIATLLNIGIVAVGLMYVRRVHTLAGLCFAGSGLFGALGSIIRRFAGIAVSIIGSPTVYTVTQIFTSLIAIVAGALLPVGIFLLANAVKQKTNPYP